MKNVNQYPEKPAHENLLNSYNLLINTHKICDDFLQFFDDIFDSQILDDKKEIGRESDLLRAALLFASSGLDSFVKQLIRDSLYDVVQVNDGAEQRLRSFIERNLEKDGALNTKLLSNALMSTDPREHFIKCLINDLTNKSLQSKDELLKVASYFDIPSQSIVDDFDYLTGIFQVRNQIAHEMDFDHKINERRIRDKEYIVNAINYLLNIAEKLISCIDEKIATSI